MPTTTGGPLAGVWIVEMDAIGPVPLAATILADMGAEIVRIARRPSQAGAWDDVGGSVVHRSRTLAHADLKSPADLEMVRQIIKRADGLIEGFRPGVMERNGLGPEPCLADNPRLVYVRMTGWGQAGTLAPRAGHDINYIAIAGALHAIGKPGNLPTVPLNLVGDYGGGAMFAVAGLLAGIIKARTDGTGQVVDVAMTDGVATLLSLFHAFMVSGKWHDSRGANLLDGAAPFYRCYRCSDGGEVAVGALEPQFFARLPEGLGIEPDRYRQNDRADWPRMQRDFETAFATMPRDAWAARFADTDACVSPVLSLTEAVDHPHNRSRQTYINRAGFDQPAPSPRFSVTPAMVREPDTRTLAEQIALWQ